MRRRSSFGAPVRPLDASLSQRLYLLAALWSTREAGLTIAAATEGPADGPGHPLPAAAERALLTFRMEIRGGGGSADAPTTRVVTVPNMGHVADADHVALQSLVDRYHVPEDQRFEALVRIRAAKMASTLAGRRLRAALRLEAFYGLLLAGNASTLPSIVQTSDQLHTQLYTAEPELIADLVGALQAEDRVPLTIRTLALRVLIGQLYDRRRAQGIVEALVAGGQSSVLTLLLRKAIAALASTAGPSAAAQYDAAFVEALIHMMALLLMNQTGTDGLIRTGAVSVLLPILE